MGDLLLLSEAQMRRIEPYFPVRSRHLMGWIENESILL